MSFESVVKLIVREKSMYRYKQKRSRFNLNLRGSSSRKFGKTITTLFLSRTQLLNLLSQESFSVELNFQDPVWILQLDTVGNSNWIHETQLPKYQQFNKFSSVHLLIQFV